MMRPYVLAIHLQPRFVSSLFDLDSGRQLSGQKLSKQMIRQVGLLAFTYYCLITVCIISTQKSGVLNASGNAIGKYKKRQEREKETAESFNASSSKVTDVSSINITRYCKKSLPLQVVPYGIDSQLENNFGSRAILKSESVSILELTFALTLAP